MSLYTFDKDNNMTRSLYPSLTLMLQALAQDNEMQFCPELVCWNDLETHHGPSLELLEKLATKLPSDLVEEFCNGEHTLVTNLSKQYGLQAVNKFLNECFDGEHTEQVFDL